MIPARGPSDDVWSEEDWIALHTDPGPRRMTKEQWAEVQVMCRRQAHYEKALDVLRQAGYGNELGAHGKEKD